jgi:cytidine deaminase
MWNLGMCRQAIREFADLNMPIYMFDPEDRFEVRTLGEVRFLFKSGF